MPPRREAPASEPQMRLVQRLRAVFCDPDPRVAPAEDPEKARKDQPHGEQEGRQRRRAASPTSGHTPRPASDSLSPKNLSDEWYQKSTALCFCRHHQLHHSATPGPQSERFQLSDRCDPWSRRRYYCSTRSHVGHGHLRLPDQLRATHTHGLPLCQGRVGWGRSPKSSSKPTQKLTKSGEVRSSSSTSKLLVR